MFKNEKNSRSLSFDLTIDNKENEVLAALNKTEIELNKINKYLYEDYKAATIPNHGSFVLEKGLKEQHPNSISRNTNIFPNEKKDHAFCSPRFNPTQEISTKNLFKIIRPDNNKEDSRKENQSHKNSTTNNVNTFTLNDCAKTQSSEASKEIPFMNQGNETPIHTFQMRGTPEKNVNASQRSSSHLGLSIKKNGFVEVSNNNFEDISEIQMIDNLEPDSFKLNDKSTLKSTNLNDFNAMNTENNENMLNNMNNLSFLLEIEREKSSKLEEKLDKKDRLLSQMKFFHNELQTTLKETQKELDKQNNIRSNSLKNCGNNETQNQIIKRLTKENQDLKKKLMEKDLKFEAYMREEKQKNEDVTYDKNMLKKLNDQMKNLAQMNKKLTGEVEIFRQHKNFFEKEKNFLKATLQENQMIIEDLTKEKEILIKRIENLVDLNKEKEKCFKMDQTYDDVSVEKTHKDLTSYKKSTQQFIESLTNMMISIAPEGYFDEKPNLKQIWKLLKKILEDYMNIKMDLKEKNETIQKLMETFSTENSKDILSYLSSLINEYDLMGKIINILKKVVGIEENIDDLESFYEIIKEKYHSA